MNIMINNIKNYIRAAIDEKAVINNYENNKNIPIYLKEEFDFYKGKILGRDVFLAEPKRSNINLLTLEKRIGAIREKTGNNIIILYDQLSDFKRKKLIEKRIAFIVSDKQMYIPFIALDINKYANRKKYKKVDKFSTAAQLAYLYLLYNNSNICIDELSKIIKRSKMTASRALDELFSLKLVNYNIKGKTGRKKYYERIDDPDYFKFGYQYLESPILKKINIYEDVNIEGTCRAGLSALSEKSMINKPKYEIRAIGKIKKYDIKSLYDSFIDNEENSGNEPLMQIEIWKYDSGILSRTGLVDIVSLGLTLADEKDERIKMAMDDLMRNYNWYTE